MKEYLRDILDEISLHSSPDNVELVKSHFRELCSDPMFIDGESEMVKWLSYVVMFKPFKPDPDLANMLMSEDPSFYMRIADMSQHRQNSRQRFDLVDYVSSALLPQRA